MKKIDNYLNQIYLKEEIQLLDEALLDVVKKFTSDKIKLFVGAIKRGDIKQAKKIGDALGVNRINPVKFNLFVKSKIPSYNESKKLAEKVLKNSIPGLSKKMLDHASGIIAIASVIPTKKNVAPKSPKARTKELIKDVIMRSRKWQDEYMDKEAESKPNTNIPQESIPDYAVGATLVFVMAALAGGSLWFIITALPGLLLILKMSMIIAAVGSVIFGIVFGLGTMKGGKK